MLAGRLSSARPGFREAQDSKLEAVASTIVETVRAFDAARWLQALDLLISD
jgi:hypothetical protein